jgi:hypothetical protein
MAALDRLGWAAGLAFRSYGLRVGIRVDDASALEWIGPALPPAWTPLASPVVDQLYSFVAGGTGRSNIRRLCLVYSGSERIARTPDPDQAVDALAASLRLYLAEAARDRVFVHAGVVGWRGRAILLPGRSCSGKSRLVAALVQAGATYYSDEYAVLDRLGRVHPFPAPLSWRDGAGNTVRRIPAAELGGPASRPLGVGLVAVARYEPGGRWRPRALSRGRGMLALLANTIPARRKPAAVMSALRRVVSAAGVWEGRRGEAEETAALLLGAAEPRSEVVA